VSAPTVALPLDTALELLDLLTALDDFHQDREDASLEGERYIPNRAMQLRASLQPLLARLENRVTAPVTRGS
jgi:hypothetical protein